MLAKGDYDAIDLAGGIMRQNAAYTTCPYQLAQLLELAATAISAVAYEDARIKGLVKDSAIDAVRGKG